MPTRVTVTLNLVDNTQRVFTFEPPAGQEMRIASRVKEMMNSKSIAFQLNDRLLVIPKSQVKSIEFTPPIDKQIEGVFSNAAEIA